MCPSIGIGIGIGGIGMFYGIGIGCFQADTSDTFLILLFPISLNRW